MAMTEKRAKELADIEPPRSVVRISDFLSDLTQSGMPRLEPVTVGGGTQITLAARKDFPNGGFIESFARLTRHYAVQARDLEAFAFWLSRWTDKYREIEVIEDPTVYDAPWSAPLKKVGSPPERNPIGSLSAPAGPTIEAAPLPEAASRIDVAALAARAEPGRTGVGMSSVGVWLPAALAILAVPPSAPGAPPDMVPGDPALSRPLARVEGATPAVSYARGRQTASPTVQRNENPTAPQRPLVLSPPFDPSVFYPDPRTPSPAPAFLEDRFVLAPGREEARTQAEEQPSSVPRSPSASPLEEAPAPPSASTMPSKAEAVSSPIDGREASRGDVRRPFPTVATVLGAGALVPGASLLPVRSDSPPSFAMSSGAPTNGPLTSGEGVPIPNRRDRVSQGLNIPARGVAARILNSDLRPAMILRSERSGGDVEAERLTGTSPALGPGDASLEAHRKSLPPAFSLGARTSEPSPPEDRARPPRAPVEERSSSKGLGETQSTSSGWFGFAAPLLGFVGRAQVTGQRHMPTGMNTVAAAEGQWAVAPSSVVGDPSSPPPDPSEARGWKSSILRAPPATFGLPALGHEGSVAPAELQWISASQTPDAVSEGERRRLKTGEAMFREKVGVAPKIRALAAQAAQALTIPGGTLGAGLGHRLAFGSRSAPAIVPVTPLFQLAQVTREPEILPEEQSTGFGLRSENRVELLPPASEPLASPEGFALGRGLKAFVLSNGTDSHLVESAGEDVLRRGPGLLKPPLGAREEESGFPSSRSGGHWNRPSRAFARAMPNPTRAGTFLDALPEDERHGQITLVAPPLTVASAQGERAGSAVQMEWSQIADRAGQLDEGGMARLAASLPPGARAIYPALPAAPGRGNLRLAPRLLAGLLQRGYGSVVAAQASRIAAKVQAPLPATGSALASLVPVGRPMGSSAEAGIMGDHAALAEAGAAQAGRGGALDYLGLPVRLAPSLGGRPELRRQQEVQAASAGRPIRPEAFAPLQRRLFPGLGSVAVEPDAVQWRKAAPAFGLRGADPTTILANDVTAVPNSADRPRPSSPRTAAWADRLLQGAETPSELLGASPTAPRTFVSRGAAVLPKLQAGRRASFSVDGLGADHSPPRPLAFASPYASGGSRIRLPSDAFVPSALGSTSVPIASPWPGSFSNRRVLVDTPSTTGRAASARSLPPGTGPSPNLRPIVRPERAEMGGAVPKAGSRPIQTPAPGIEVPPRPTAPRPVSPGAIRLLSNQGTMAPEESLSPAPAFAPRVPTLVSVERPQIRVLSAARPRWEGASPDMLYVPPVPRPAGPPLAIQRVATGAGGGTRPAAAKPPAGTKSEAKPREGGEAAEINSLATEVWSLLRRRLANEAERRGRS